MSKFITELGTAVETSGKRGVYHCVTRYLFGETKLINLTNKSDNERVAVINDYTDSIMSAFKEGGLPSVEKAVNRLKNVYS